MSTHVVRLIAATGVWFTMALIMLVGFSTWYTVTEIRRPPDEQAFYIDKIEVLNPVVGPGKPVLFRLTGRRDHACPSIIASFWMDDSGKPVTRFPPITGGYTPVDTDGYTVEFLVPAPSVETLTGLPAAPGVYHYRATNAPLCPNLIPTEMPDVTICLVVPGQPKPACAG
jgi:hypothetical protein